MNLGEPVLVLRFWMMNNIQYKETTALQRDIETHLEQCDGEFEPILSARVNIEEYSRKIFENAILFEAWVGVKLVGLIAVYLNRDDSNAFITSVSVVSEYFGNGIAYKLLEMCIKKVKHEHISEINLEVNKDNKRASALYKRFGFKLTGEKGSSNLLKLEC